MNLRTQEPTNSSANLAAANGRNSDCIICGNSLSFHQQWAGDICDDWRCRWTRLDIEMRAHRYVTAQVIGEANPETYRALVIPHRQGMLTGLPFWRRAEHLRFLQEVVVKASTGAQVDEAQVGEPGEPDADEPPPALAGAVCAVCGGACCHRGGDRAFLDVADIQRVMAVKPDMEPSQIVDAYAMQLPVRSIAGSCVYHTSVGCALPRCLRAGICNIHRCRGLKQAERWIRDHGTTRLYVVARKDNIIRRSAFVQAGNIRHYPPADNLIKCETLKKRISNIEQEMSNIEVR